MALALGSSAASKIYLGATEIALAYLGTTQVYSAGGAFSAEAQTYFDRLDTAGDTTYVDYKQPLANYIDSLVALGGAYWDTMESSASFVGVGIQGVTVPLRNGMPSITNNNFVAGDLDQLTGLLGDASTKYIATGLTGSDLSQNDHSFSVYATSVSKAGFVGGTYSTNFNSPIALAPGTTTTNFYSTGPLDASTKITSAPALVGLSRSASTEYIARTNQGDETFTRSSGTINTGGLSLFAVGAGVAPTASRLATYHAGPALDLSTLQGLQETLLAEIAGVGFSTEAANYFGRLVNAGDTTFLAYRQPLANYIDSLVTLGGAYWDTMLSSTSFVGVGIQGITVPLRDGMTVPTNNNFVAADLDQLTGLKGDASTKYISTGLIGTDLAQNDNSISAHITEVQTAGSYIAGSGEFPDVCNHLLVVGGNYEVRNMSATRLPVGAIATGLFGSSRSVSTGYDYIVGGSTGSKTLTSAAPSTKAYSVFASSAALPTDVRLATYHAGPALDLATLEGLQDTLITEIAAI